MNFEPTPDQRALLDAIGTVVARHAARPLGGGGRHEHSAALERDLEDGGYFDAMATEGLGPVAAAAMVMALSQLPCCAEIGASALLRPALGTTLPRPCAVLVNHRRAPARYLAQARCVLAIGPQGVWQAALQPGDAQPLDSLFAVPMGVLVAPDTLDWQPVAFDMHAALDQWRLALAAELVGCLQAGLAAVVAHVSHRRQFGRPLGSFQAVQHRLAAGASTLEGLRWLTLAAAAGHGPGALPSLAAAQAQQLGRTLGQDLHQFMGAMGLTLEHPLHRFTYRARRLQGELGGAEHQFAAAAALAWPPCP